MPSGIYTRTKDMNTGKNPNSHGNSKGKHWKVKDTINMHSRKGIELSKSHKDNIRKSMLGRNILWEDKISKAHIGKTLSEQAKRRLRENAKINPNYGMKGKHHTKDSKDKIRIRHLGKKQTEEHKINAVNGRRRRNGYFVSTETKEKHRKFRRTQVFPIKDSSIEIKIQNFLKQLGITFFTHQYIKIEHGYQCDILIPSMNLVIECDGDYWHKYPIGNDLDHIRTKELIEKGFRVLRLWEFEIKEMNLDNFKKKMRVA